MIKNGSIEKKDPQNVSENSNTSMIQLGRKMPRGRSELRKLNAIDGGSFVDKKSCKV